jgi:hypothetical protein
MSSAAVRAPRTPARGLTIPGRAPGRPALPPRLRVVTAPAHARSRAGLVVVCATVLVAALVGLLLLNVTLEQGAYELQRQHKAATKLTETRDALAEQLRAKAAPDALARQAEKLGMVPGSGAAFLGSGDSAVLGQAAPAKAAPKAAPSVATTTAPTARPAVKASTSATPSPSKASAKATRKPAATGAAPTKVRPSPKPSGAAR